MLRLILLFEHIVGLPAVNDDNDLSGNICGNDRAHTSLQKAHVAQTADFRAAFSLRSSEQEGIEHFVITNRGPNC